MYYLNVDCLQYDSNFSHKFAHLNYNSILQYYFLLFGTGQQSLTGGMHLTCVIAATINGSVVTCLRK